MLHLLFNLLKALNANQSPGSLALSFVLGMILGLTPLISPHNLLIVFLMIALRINFTAVFLALGFFSGLSYLLDPLFNQVGNWILHLPELQTVFTQWYNNAFWRWMNFNYTIVMGSVVTSIVLSPLVFIFFLQLIKLYRHRFLQWINKFKIVHMLKTAKIVNYFSNT